MTSGRHLQSWFFLQCLTNLSRAHVFVLFAKVKVTKQRKKVCLGKNGIAVPRRKVGWLSNAVVSVVLGWIFFFILVGNLT